MSQDDARERMISLVLLALFLLVAGGTGLFVYRQTHASDAEPAVQDASADPVTMAGPSALRSEAAPKPLIPPRLLNQDDLRRGVEKFYPAAEKAAGKEGRVVLAMVIEADGSVSHSEVRRSGGPAFDEAATKAASALRFAPARRGEDPVAVQIEETFDFTPGR